MIIEEVAMTKLEWCKDVCAPSVARKGDEYILSVLGSTYDNLVAHGLIEGEEAEPKQSSPTNTNIPRCLVGVISAGIKDFGVERVIADKILAMCTSERLYLVRSLQDLYAITDSIDFDAKKVAEYIMSDSDGMAWNNLPYSDVMLNEMRKAYDSLRTKARCVKPGFREVMSRFSAVVEGVQSSLLITDWSHERLRFEERVNTGQPRGMRDYDTVIGKTCNCIIGGECALQRKGLTRFKIENLTAWTPIEELDGVRAPHINWVYNPNSNLFEDVTQSSESTSIFEPTKERAIVEYIQHPSDFNETVLVRSLSKYTLQCHDLSELYRIAYKYELPNKILDYWVEKMYLSKR